MKNNIMVDLKTEKIKINTLVPANYNPREITSEDYNKLKQSMDEFGVVDPIIINLNDNTIIGGHQRFDVLFYEDQVSELNLLRLGDVGWVFPDTELKIKDKNHEKALNLALNRIHGAWDFDKLNNVLVELEELKLDQLTGFNLELDDIDYDFVQKHDLDFEEEENIDDYSHTVSDDELDDIVEDEINEDSEETIIEEQSNEKIIPKTKPRKQDRIKNGFVKQNDIYKIGNSTYVMFGNEDNEMDRTKLLNKKPKKDSFNPPTDFKKIRTINQEINYYMCDDAEILENILIENNGNFKKVI